MYTLILMVSVLRTLYARATYFLSTYEEVDNADDEEDAIEKDIASSLFTPQKLWKAFGDGPLEGLKRWYALIESHLRCEFDYSVKEVPCLCGLYGLDNAVFEEAAVASNDWKQLENRRNGNRNGNAHERNGTESDRGVADREGSVLQCDTPKSDPTTTTAETPNTLDAFLRETGMSLEMHTALVKACDDYVLLLMQNAKFGVQATLRRFRVDPRVYVKSFVLRDASDWFARHQIFNTSKEGTIAEVHAFLTRCCKHRKLRLLVAHRGEDAQMFPLDHQQQHHTWPHRDSDTDGNSSVLSGLTAPRSRLPSSIFGSEPVDSDVLPEAFYLQSMMFVDPWEVEAEGNVHRYMHHSLHVELGWDRLSPICSETCDSIVESVFKDPDLISMWKNTGGEGWLVTAITQYRLDGLHSYRTLYQHKRRGLSDKEEPRIPFLVEIYSRSQRNAMFQEAGLPHRFVGVVTVELFEAKDLIACSWLGNWSDPYVFLELAHYGDKPRETAEEWSLQTYRSQVGEGGVNPRWKATENKFMFRFAIPTHDKHTANPSRELWNADSTEQNRASMEALEKLLPSVFSGPPAMLQCTVYQKNKYPATLYICPALALDDAN
ncbi:hypothetical protein BBP00_00002406 [Phytophthora kernoviae]|uniref:Uncharacterized protein n=1 Tax=Phytophthora kernoviae TaxID=325452 RepID=A0A3F2RXE9_9STRA|nr:hypothetical protein BBP00_00002406 [Phytophthora kernoviae]